MLGSEPVQIVEESLRLDVPLVDLSALSDEERAAAVAAVLEEEATAGFHLATGPLIRARLLRLTTSEHILLLAADHTVIDGWSLGILRSEVVAAYEAHLENIEPTLPELPVRYGDYAAWQRHWLSGERYARLLRYWQDQLDGELPLLELPTDRPRPAVQRYRGTAQTFEIPAVHVERLTAVAHAEGATLFMILLAATGVALARYARQDEIVFGSPVANRELPELERLIGLFVNVLVLRIPVHAKVSFRTVLRSVRDTCVGAFGHQEMPFERLVQELRPERDLSRTPLFQALFAFLDTSGEPPRMGDVTWEPYPWIPPVSRTDLAFWLETAGGAISGTLEYSTDLFDHDTITRFLEHFQNLLHGVTENPDRLVSELPLLSDDERRRVLVEWNATEHNLGTEPVHRTIRDRAARVPDTVAIVHQGREVTYRELEDRSNRLAAYLLHVGVPPGARVGIMLERSPRMIETMLAVWKTGASYVPLDPEFPSERVAFMAADAELSALVTESALLERVPESSGTVVSLDTAAEEIATCSEAATPITPGVDDVAYIIYTSGSTGQPKGVEVLHRGVANFLGTMVQTPGIEPDAVLVAVTTLSFDIAVLELLLPLTVGARVVIASKDDAADGRRLQALMEQSGVTIMQATPATWRLLLSAGWEGRGGMTVLAGGEALAPDLATELLQRADTVWNMYGPTETTVWSTCHRVSEADDRVLIGRPIANTTVYVVDEMMQPVPIGVPGELLIGGAGVAKGYWKRPQLTAERFVPNPFAPADGPVYRTGDLVRFRPHGALEYHRRLDNQVKIRGFRIELGEIETALKQYEGVEDAVAAVRSFGRGDDRLVAYVVPAEGRQEPTGTELRAFLRESLPAYMIPGAFVTLDALPLTPNGKVDRRALPDPTGLTATAAAPVPPRTETERLIADIWQQALGIADVGVNDNFFDLGGHSLLSMQVIGTIEERTGVRLGARDIVLQTLGQVAAMCEKPAEPGDQPGAPEHGLAARLARFVRGGRKASA